MKVEIEIPSALVRQIRRGLQVYEVPEAEIARFTERFAVGTWEGMCAGGMAQFEDVWRYDNREDAQRVAKRFLSAVRSSVGTTTAEMHKLSYTEGGATLTETIQDLLTAAPEHSPSRCAPERNLATVDSEGVPTPFAFGKPILLSHGGNYGDNAPSIDISEKETFHSAVLGWALRRAGGLDLECKATGRLLYVVPFEIDQIHNHVGARVSLDELYRAGKNLEVVTTKLRELDLLSYLRRMIAERAPRDIVIWPASYYFQGGPKAVTKRLERGLNWRHERYEPASFELQLDAPISGSEAVLS